MNLIATSDFRNTHKFNIPGAVDPLHVHKGAIFEVDETDPAKAQVLAQLNLAGRIVDVDGQPAMVKKIQAEVAAEEAKSKKDAKK